MCFYSLFLIHVSDYDLVLSCSNQQSGNKESTGLAESLSPKKPDSSSTDNMKNSSVLEEYKRAAPQLLNELAHFLSQHKWTGRCCIARGVLNILNYTWHDVTAGMVHLKSPEQTAHRRGKLGVTSRQVSAKSKRGAGERENQGVRRSVPSERKPQVNPNPCVKRRKQKSSRGK